MRQARPERTVYRITPAGRAEFKAGLSMIGALGPDQAISRLRERLGQLDEHAGAQRSALDQLRPVLPRLFLVEVEWRRYYETGEFPDDLGEFVER